MNIEKEILADRQAKLSVTYTQEEFEGYKRRGARKIAKSTKIPGFRPGKAPYQVILNHFGEGSIIQEAIDIILDEDYGKILDEAEITPSGPGNLENIEYDPVRFVFMVPLEPEINLGDYREIRKPYEPAEFDAQKVDEFIDNLRKNASTIVPSDKPAKEGDLVYFNLSGEFLNPEEDEDATITDKTPQQVLIPDEGKESSSEWPYPGFARELLGVSAGDVKEIQHSYAEDDDDEEFQGKTALFTVEVQSVKELELPEMDDQFLKSMGEYDSVEDFRQEVEDRLKEEHQDSYDKTYFDELLKKITENAKINYPPQMLAHEEEHVLEDIKDRLERQNMDFETYLKLRSMDEETFMAEEIRPAAKSRLERSLIVDAIINSEKLKIDEEMLKQHINDVMLEIHYSGNAEEMQKQMGKDEFSRAISMESVNRTMNAQLKDRLKLIATGQPIPDDDEQKQPEIVEETETLPEVVGEEELQVIVSDEEEIKLEDEAIVSDDEETPIEKEPVVKTEE